MARAHDVVLGLEHRAERGQPLVLADGVEPVATPGENLVRIGLVPDVPEDLVAWGVQQAVQRHRELAGAEIGAEVAADLADRVDDQLPHLLGDLLELRVRELPQVGRRVDRVEQPLGLLAVLGVVGHLGVSGVDEVRDPSQIVGFGVRLGERFPCLSVRLRG